MPERLSKKLPPLAVALIEAARWAPSADNSQPWRFGWEGHRLWLDYDEERVGGRTFAPNAHATLLAMGAATENILQMVAHLGVELEWGFSAGEHYAWFDLDPKSLNRYPETSPVLFQRHTNRLSFRKSALDTALLTRLEDWRLDANGICVLPTRAAINAAATLVRHASILRFQNPEIHKLLASSLRFSAAEAQDGLDVNTLGLPPGGGFMLRLVKDWRTMSFLNRFGLHQMFALMEASKVKQAGAVVAIFGENSRQGTLSAGRLMEQVWIELNNQNVAVHPFYVATDQLQRYQAGYAPLAHAKALSDLERETAALLSRQGSVLHMLLRIGYPKKKPLLSKRLSCSNFL